MSTRMFTIDKPMYSPTKSGVIAFLCLGLALVLLAGCNRNNADEAGEPELLDTLPKAWIPIDNDGIWKSIDIDTDIGRPEHLLFFTYDNQQKDAPSGPSGAVIYDLQDNTDSLIANSFAISVQPSGSYIPYRVLPNYWSGSDTGFIAPTGRHSQITYDIAIRQAITQTRTIERIETVNEEAVITADEEGVREVLIQDGGKTITVAWWRDKYNGYGAASVHADAGFTGQRYEDRDNVKTALLSFSGRHPFHDRSELCHVSIYTREYITETAIDGIPLDIKFVAQPDGIDFCTQPAPMPFYPEAVVLKYLMAEEPQDALIDETMDDADRARLDEQVATPIRSGAKRMLGLFGQRQIPFYDGGESGATVCIELIDEETGQRQTYTIALHHVQPDANKRSTDEFRIRDVDLIDPPREGMSVDCNIIVPNGTPGRTPIQ